MRDSRRPPVPVAIVAVVYGLFGLASLVATVVTAANEGIGEGVAAGVIGVVLFGGLAWKLWEGTRYGWVFAIVLSSLLILAGVVTPTPIVGALVFMLFGLATILLLTVPRSAREYFTRRRRQVA